MARIARVVVEVEPFHLDRPFDYAIDDDLTPEPVVGSRVEVVFSGRRRRGLVVGLSDDTDVPASRLRSLRRVLGEHQWVTRADLEVFQWAAERYGATVADVVRHALPNRTVAVERDAAEKGWLRLSHEDPPPRPTAARPPGPEGWEAYDGNLPDLAYEGHGSVLWRPLADEDVGARLAELAEQTLAGGRDVLLVVPDRSSRIADAVAEALDVALVDVRGISSPRALHRRWLQARCGQVRVVVGERGVAFWPLDHLGLAVVVDEANPALKERRSPRHHARDVVLERARRARALGLVISTVPSSIGWELLRERRLQSALAPRAVEVRHAPEVLVDHADDGPRTRLGRRAVPALRAAVADGGYGVVLAARRGQGTALACSACGARRRCPRCAASIAATTSGITCRTCGFTARHRPCEDCGSREWVPLAAGAERLGEELARAVDVPVAVLEGYDQPVPPPPAVLVMTRGSVLDAAPGPVGVVVLPDLEAMARMPFVGAPEDTLRLAFAAGSWAAPDGQVIVPSRTSPAELETSDEPEAAVLRALKRWDPGSFWRHQAPRRATIGLPPARAAIALEVHGGEEPVREVLAADLSAAVLGPVSIDGARRLLLLTDDRSATLARLRPLREAWSKAGADARLDVDPVDLL